MSVSFDGVRPGMYVQIKKPLMGRHVNEAMIKYEGTVCTVRAVRDRWIKIEEDKTDFFENAEPGWNWHPHMIEKFMENPPVEPLSVFEAPDLTLLFGGAL